MAVQPTYKRLSNGLQSLSEASPDYELAPVGIASMHDQAQKLAEYGRNGDIYVIHAAEGETVIPMEVLNANPQIKQLLFAQMKDMGLDPQEFVVGNELNSINPVTGLPEFFFKSIFRAVKKAVKKVFKFAKKIAPVALPIAASLFFPTYPVLGAAIGGGLGSLAGGGSLKDAFKNAMISGGTAALWGGIKGLQGADPIGFMEGAKRAVTGVQGAPSMAEQWRRLSGGDIEDFLYAAPSTEETAALQSPTFKTRGFTPASATQTPSVSPGVTYDHGTNTWFDASGKVLPGDPLRNPNFLNVADQTKPITDRDLLMEVLRNRNKSAISPEMSTALESVQGVTPEVLGQNLPIDSTGPLGTDIGGTLKRTVFGTDYTGADVLKEAGLENLPTPVTRADITAMNAIKKTAADIAQKASAKPLRKYGPLGLASLGAVYAGGMFDPPKDEEEATVADLEFGLAGGVLEPNKLFAKDPRRFKIPVDPQFGQENVLTGQQVFAPSIFAADGGMIRGPGTGTSDSIPGWLSDGEFVLTERAVRGADPTGQGRRDAGANNLYNIMRNFEMRA